MSDGLTLEKLKIDERLRAVENHIAEGNIIFKNLDNTLMGLSGKIGIQNGRINKLENWKSYIVGSMGAIGAIFGMVAVIISWTKH